VELVVDEQILAPSMTCSSATSHLNFLVFGISRTGPSTIDVGCVKCKTLFLVLLFFWDAFVDVRLFCKFVITCLWLSTDHEQGDEATDSAPNQSKLRVWPLVKILKALPSTSTIFWLLFFSLSSQLHNKMH
jgi:hypothetical protein